jgi:hypothetical protein
MSPQNEDTFTEAEVFQALSWGMPDTDAHRMARAMADDPALIESIPEQRELGPQVTMYSEDMLLLHSLVSENARIKAERRLADRRLQTQLTPGDRAEWEERRANLKRQLLAAGKSVPD